MTAGFKCYRREVLEKIDIWSIKSTGYAFQVETTFRVLKAGFRVKEIPIEFVERVVGHSKMTRRIINEAASMVLKLRFNGRY
jgi:dolichol-phosphate mannosyltransferase